MFSQSQAFSGFSVDDVAAPAPSTRVPGLRVSEANGMLTLHLVGGGRVLLYPKRTTGPRRSRC